MSGPDWPALRGWARERMAAASSGHGWDHIERVERLAVWLAGQVGACEDIVRAAALLHDVGREAEALTGEDHALASARLARGQLTGWGFGPDEVERIVACIEEHRFRGGRLPSSLEAQVVSDADKLDALGAAGIYRVFATGAARGRSLEQSLQHFDNKLLRLEERLYTEPARRLGRVRTERLRLFLSWLEDETGVGSDG